MPQVPPNLLVYRAPSISSVIGPYRDCHKKQTLEYVVYDTVTGEMGPLCMDILDRSYGVLNFMPQLLDGGGLRVRLGLSGGYL